MWASRLSPRALLAALANDSGPPLFYVLEKPLVAAAESLGARDALARLLPWAALLLVALAARSLPGARARAVFVAALAASPLLTLYAAEARAYAPLAAADLALFVLVFRGRPRGSRLVAIAFLAAATAWLHYLGAIFVGAVAIGALVRKERRPAAAVASGLATFLVWTPVAASQPAAATAWMREAPLASAAAFLSGLGGGGRIPAPFGPPLPAILLAAGGLAAPIAAAAALRARRADGGSDAALPIGIAAIYLGAILLASVARPLAFPGRTEIAVLPLFLWGVAAAAGTDRAAFRSALAIVGVGLVSTLLVLSRGLSAEPGPARLARRVAEEAAPRDLVVAGGSFYLPARLDADRGTLRAPLASFPADLAAHPGWIAAAPPSPADDEGLLTRLADRAPGSRVFLLLHPLLVSTDLARSLAARGTVPVERTAEGALLVWTVGSGPGRAN